VSLNLQDRVKETTTVTGTGTATLLGATTGFQSFAVVGNANTTYYCIADQGGANWEVGIGTYTASGTTLARTTVLSSSNAGSLVAFTAGIKDVFVTYPSSKGLWKDASGNAIGLGTPASGVVTNLTGTASININGTVGATTATTGAFTNLAYTGTLTGSTGVLNIGSGQVYKDASGNVGIGTSSPSYKLDVTGSIRATTQVLGPNGSAATPSISSSGETNAGLFFGDDGVGSHMAISTAGVERVRFDRSGNVGIGTSSPSSRFEVANNTSNAEVRISTAQNAYSSLYLNAWSLDRAQLRAEAGNPGAGSGTGSGILSFWTAGNPTMTERMRIDSSGNVLVGATSVIGSGKVSVAFDQGSNTGVAIKNTSATNTGAFLNFLNSTGGGQGAVYQASSVLTVFATTSDYRLKDNLQTLSSALDKVNALKPYKGTWKHDNSLFIGFIAHELQEQFPDVVIGEKDAVNEDGTPKYQMVDASSASIIATLTAAIQELKTIIDTQQTLIEALTERLTALENK
jgi:hypothetical protein